MIKVHVTHEFHVHHLGGSPLAADDLHREGERLMEALLALEACNDDIADVTTCSEADRGIVIAEMLVVAGDEGEAVNKAKVVTRSAIHTIGGATPEWEESADRHADYRPAGVKLEYV